MGIFSQNTNRRKTNKEKHTYKWKRQVKAAKKKAKGPVTINIEDAELFSTELLKNKLKNPRNNIKISNKKKKRILKRLKHHKVNDHQKEDDEEEGDFDMEEMLSQTHKGATEASTSGSSSCNSQPSSSGTAEATVEATTTTTTTGKKKAKGKKKKGKGKGTGGSVEDVEMEEL